MSDTDVLLPRNATHGLPCGTDQFQPTHRAGYHVDRLTWLLDWLRDHPDATLASGEGGLLAAEIHRLRAHLDYLTSEDA